VAVEFSDALLRLVAENQDLLVLGLAQNGSGNRGAAHRGVAHGDIIVTRRKHDAIEGNVGTDLAGDQVAADNVAFGDPVLLAVGLDDRVHNLGTIPAASPAVNEGAHVAGLTAGLNAW